MTNSCADNTSEKLSVSNFNICDLTDTTKPTLTEVTRIGASSDNKTNDNTPSYIFSSSEEGTITYGGSCSSSTTSTAAGDKTITFNSLAVGTYSDCTIQVTDCNSNISDNLSVSTFEYYRREELFSVTYGNGNFVAVGDYGQIVTSSTGDNRTWTTQTSGTTYDLYDVGTDNSTFVAVGYRGKLIRSVDNGSTWSTPSTWGQSSISGTTTTLSAVAGQIDNALGANDFVVVTNSTTGKIGYSTDNGSTWSRGVDFASEDIAYGDDLYVGDEMFLAVGSDGALQKSINSGRSWLLSSISAQDLNGIAFGSGTYTQNTTGLAAFYDNITVSKTGVATVGSISGQDNHTIDNHTNVTLSGGSGSGAKATVRIDNGSIYSITITSAGVGYKIGDNLTLDNATIGGTDNASLLVATVSPDNLTSGTYTNVTLTGDSGSGAKATVVVANDNISSITITSVGTGFSVGDNITIDNASISSNGSVHMWVKTLYSYEVPWGVFVIAADGGVLLYSNDNTSNWNVATQTDTTTNLYSVAYGNEKFVAVGYSNMNSSSHGGVILVSADNGSSWSLKTSDYVFDDITFGNGKFIGVQQRQYDTTLRKWRYERIYSSTDGETWTLVHDPNYD